MTLGKLMGFLGITADITGFSLDTDVLMIGLIISSLLQLIKSEVAQENRAKLREERNAQKNDKRL